MKKLPFFLISFLLPLFIVSKILFIGYFCADNNLYNGFLKNYNQMIEGSKNIENTDIIVLLDSPFYSYIFKIVDGKSETLKVFNNINSGDFQNISNFFSTFYKYDYEKRIMVLWDHGNGWYNFTTKDKSIFFDNHPFDFISITDGELKNIFIDIYKKTGKKTDLLIFDACLMQSVEVIYEIKDYVSFVVGSEGIVPYSGFPYNRILSFIDTLNDTELLSTYIVKEFFDFYSDSSYSDLTVSSIKTTNFVQDIRGLQILKRDDFSIIDQVDVSCELLNSLVLNETKNEKYKGIKLFFPEKISTLLNLYKDYINLSVDKDFNIIKREFLTYEVQDTFPPLPVKNISIVDLGNNDFQINFDKTYDFSNIKEYIVTHSNFYYRYFENFDSLPLNFLGNVFLTNVEPYSKPYSLFSKNFVFEIFLPEKENIINFKYKGLFGDSVFYVYLNDKVVKVFKSEFTDWKEFYLKVDSGYLKVVFNINENKDFYIYIDDLKIYHIKDSNRSILKTNSGKVHKIGYGDNLLFLEAKDIHDNISSIDTLLEFFVEDTIKTYSYPNPAKDQIKIFSEYKGNYDLFIFASDGKKIFETNGIKLENTIPVNTEKFKNGLYYYILDIDGKILKGKFFVEK